MRVFMASIPLDGRKVVVIGGGEPGVAKARLIARTGAQLAWFTPDETPPQSDVPTGVVPVAGFPEPYDLAGAALVFIAMFGAPEAQMLASAARAHGALVNLVDQPDLCDFYTPALVDRGEVVIGIATGGGAPILARDLRALIERTLPAGLDILAGLSRQIRDQVKASIDDPIARRRFWERAFRGRAADLAAQGDAEGARAELQRLLAGAEPAVGRVWFTAAPAEPDLLTLRALLALQDADVVVHDADTPAAVIDQVRRDARRVSLGGVAPAEVPALLADLAAQGQRVVRFTGAAGAALERASLAAAGLETVEIPSVRAADGA
jgi:uroporphyrin-III C-methyltransferase/precorrin-2 dehydrogenase/sirohydrochlorin ferrochelatase